MFQVQEFSRGRLASAPCEQSWSLPAVPVWCVWAARLWGCVRRKGDVTCPDDSSPEQGHCSFTLGCSQIGAESALTFWFALSQMVQLKMLLDRLCAVNWSVTQLL